MRPVGGDQIAEGARPGWRKSESDAAKPSRFAGIRRVNTNSKSVASSV